MKILKSAKENGYASNKDVKFKSLNSIYIDKFRSLADREIVLGDNITLISGKNGTMKSSILGLIAHPFSSPNDAVDVFNKPLKTRMSDVFRLSNEKDKDTYIYYINATTTTGVTFMEQVRMYHRPREERHRITVSKGSKADAGNFLLNTSYINLKRLFPIVDTKAEVVAETSFTKEERKRISDAYMMIMTRNAFNDFDCISDHKDKNTLGPKNSSYDFNSISSGEDNLGNILMKMLAFERYQSEESDQEQLQGIFCIDEIEASLHPVALTNLFDYLLYWSKQFHVQIVATTHSLYLIEYALKYQNNSTDNKRKVALNIISTVQVGSDENYKILNNPAYRDAYRELTLKNPEDAPLFKVIILCEDKLAVSFLKKIVKKRSILSNLEFISDISGKTGTSHTALKSLAVNGARLLEDCVLAFDPDVDGKILEKVRKANVAALILPDATVAPGNKGMAIEKSVIKYIASLDGAHNVFAVEEKMAFLNSLHHLQIKESDITPNDNVEKYKRWHEQNSSRFNTLLGVYVNESSDAFEKFKTELLKIINDKRAAKGLSKLSY